MVLWLSFLILSLLLMACPQYLLWSSWLECFNFLSLELPGSLLPAGVYCWSASFKMSVQSLHHSVLKFLFSSVLNIQCLCWNSHSVDYSLGICLVTFPLLWRDTRTKEIYRIKHLIGSLCTFSVDEPMTSWQRTWKQASKHGDGTATESYMLRKQSWGRKGERQLHGNGYQRLLKPQSLLTVTNLFQQGHAS